jgi:hypothetical protein
MLEWFRGHLERLQVEANVLRHWHNVVAGVCLCGVVVQISGWIYSAVLSGVLGRHIVSLFGYALTLSTLGLNWYCLNAEPQMLLMFALQLVCLIALFLVSTTSGTLAILVDLCKWNQVTTRWSCGATIAEYAAAWIVAACLCLIFASSQKKIVMLVDRGILTGIGTRLSRIE